jgi:hypothetical protein
MSIPEKKPYESLAKYLERSLPGELEAGKSRGKATADIMFKFNEKPDRKLFAPMIGFAGGDGGDDPVAATLNYNITNTQVGATVNVTIYQNTLGGTILYNGGVGSGTINVNSGDTILVFTNITSTPDPYTTLGEYRVPDSGGYTQLFFQASGPSGGQMAPSGNFVITSGEITAGLTIAIS